MTVFPLRASRVDHRGDRAMTGASADWDAWLSLFESAHDVMSADHQTAVSDTTDGHAGPAGHYRPGAVAWMPGPRLPDAAYTVLATAFLLVGGFAVAAWQTKRAREVGVHTSRYYRTAAKTLGVAALVAAVGAALFGVMFWLIALTGA